MAKHVKRIKYTTAAGEQRVYVYVTERRKTASQRRAAGPNKARRAKRVQANLSKIKLARGCVDCGFSACPAALHFHHLGNKSFALSRAKTFQASEVEVEKCIVLCANCHAIRHAEEREAAAASRLLVDIENIL
ncbi:hypothetical protein LGH82_33165 [Mesorhizobium sp. PAMC28654]|uniref:hypothetical protein n=1 Tax=Mesorhizobium sp. PAMC28654 TaxID=2880934 RepID=UPI001D0A15F0|nr:hypothetical protein [Mesorhizobium sp. PAMC28654]UDL89832.1 hypothetical protein LGH82_33165 [Mesorhizobium sp. PAMC28654]